MIEVKVLINNFRDIENYPKKINIIRNEKEMEVQNELLQIGDRYKITKKRYKELSEKGIVAKYQENSKVNKED